MKYNPKFYKVCCVCDLMVHRTKFGKNRLSPDGLRRSCLPCAEKARRISGSKDDRRRAQCRRSAHSYRTDPRHRLAILARLVLGEAVRKGVVKRPAFCSECGAGGRIEAHHENYAKPMAVRWLCAWCHRKIPPVPAKVRHR